MNRRQLAFVILVNTLVSLVVALGVAWAVEARRPDLEELAAIYTPSPGPVLAAPVATPVPAPTSVATGPEAVPPTPVAVTENSDGQPYVVEAGDSLLSIAGKFGVTVDEIVKANGLTNPDFVFSGQRLTIPKPGAAPAAAGATPTTSPTTVAQGVQIARFEGAGDLASEQVLIVNESNIAVNLQGWRFERDGGPVYVFGNSPLFPGSSLRIHSGSGDDTSIDLFWTQSEPIWQSGATARLLDGQAQVVDTVAVP